MANLSTVDQFNGSAFYPGAASFVQGSFAGGLNTSIGGTPISTRVNEATGFEDVVVRVPRREQVNVVHAPPQVQTQFVPGPVVERVQRVVAPGPVVEQKVVVPGPVVERVEHVPGPVRVVERLEKVLVEQPYERIERVVVPSPDIIKEVKVEIPGPIVEKVVDVQIPGEEIIKRVEVKVPVEGPVVERVQRVDVPRDVVREVIQTRPIPRHVPVPVYQPGPVREVVVRVRDEHLVRENMRLLRIRDRELAKLNRRRYDQDYEYLRDQTRMLKSQLRGVQGGYFHPAATLEFPQHNWGSYNPGFQGGFQSFGGFQGGFAAPVSYAPAPVSYAQAPVFDQSYAAPVQSYAAPVQYDAAPVANYGTYGGYTNGGYVDGGFASGFGGVAPAYGAGYGGQFY